MNCLIFWNLEISDYVEIFLVLYWCGNNKSPILSNQSCSELVALLTKPYWLCSTGNSPKGSKMACDEIFHILFLGPGDRAIHWTVTLFDWTGLLPCILLKTDFTSQNPPLSVFLSFVTYIPAGQMEVWLVPDIFCISQMKMRRHGIIKVDFTLFWDKGLCLWSRPAFNSRLQSSSYLICVGSLETDTAPHSQLLVM